MSVARPGVLEFVVRHGNPAAALQYLHGNFCATAVFWLGRRPLPGPPMTYSSFSFMKTTNSTASATSTGTQQTPMTTKASGQLTSYPTSA